MTPGFVYIIYSEKWDRYYVGSTQDLNNRIGLHNAGRNKSTKGGDPWVLRYSKRFEEIPNARKRELEIKKKKSKKYIEWLISSRK